MRHVPRTDKAKQPHAKPSHNTKRTSRIALFPFQSPSLPPSEQELVQQRRHHLGRGVLLPAIFWRGARALGEFRDRLGELPLHGPARRGQRGRGVVGATAEDPVKCDSF
jgi:hypothetical protein